MPKIRARTAQIIAVERTYGEFLARLAMNRMMSPAFVEVLKQECWKFQQAMLRRETNPAWQIPFDFVLKPEENTVIVRLDLSEVLIIDQ